MSKPIKSRKSKQLSLLTERKIQRAHGGSLAVGKRRSKRPLNLKLSHHITMKSHHAIGSRSLFRHKKMILDLIRKNSLKFHVKVYESAIQGNHLHLLVKAQSREGLQNFFRVVAGHIAQRILQDHPLKPERAGGAPQKSKVNSVGASEMDKEDMTGGAPQRDKEDMTGGAPNRDKEGQRGGAPARAQGCQKNQRRFWSYLVYSRIVSWGREFSYVKSYILKNTLELLQMIAYEPRGRKSVKVLDQEAQRKSRSNRVTQKTRDSS